MTLEPANRPHEMNESISPQQFPVRGWRRVWYGVFVVVVPTFSFWATQIISPEWQSGNLQDYLALLLSAEASLIFLFLLAYSILCYIFLLIAPHLFSGSFLVRFGIYSGVLLALQYSVILFLHLFDNRYIYAIFLLWFFPLYFPRFYRWALEKWIKRYVRGWMLLVVAIFYGTLTFFFNDALLPVFLAVLAIITSAPFWSFLLAMQASIWLYKNHETVFSLPRGLGVTAWVAGYVAAWRYDILKMYELYSQLPLVPPDCYIATAAAKGHSHIVGSRTVQLANGKSMQVNRQLHVFKCAELALMAVVPQVHQPLRKVYDVIGKPLAHKIHDPLLADIAYLSLKPAEWLAGYALKIVVPEIRSTSIYN